MAEKNKYDLQYLYNSYKKHYKKVDMDKANQYSDLAQELHGVDLRERYHQKLAKKEQNAGMFGLGKTKKLRYG
jgi:hypothetical protein|tara:strand:- start:1253 stop:1471 length:219 start_codon:yes stop_codon:yes gene_type:complete